MKNKIYDILWEMYNLRLSFADDDGCDYFTKFLKEHNVDKKDLQTKSFKEICKDYWNVDLSEIREKVDQEYIECVNKFFVE